MFAVGTSYNSLLVTLGVFDSKEALEKTIQEMGAKFIPEQEKTLRDGHKINGKSTYIVKEHWVATEEFCNNMDILGLDTYEMRDLFLEIREFKPNTISFGYNVD